MNLNIQIHKKIIFLIIEDVYLMAISDRFQKNSLGFLMTMSREGDSQSLSLLLDGFKLKVAIRRSSGTSSTLSSGGLSASAMSNLLGGALLGSSGVAAASAMSLLCGLLGALTLSDDALLGDTTLSSSKLSAMSLTLSSALGNNRGG